MKLTGDGLDARRLLGSWHRTLHFITQQALATSAAGRAKTVEHAIIDRGGIEPFSFLVRCCSTMLPCCAQLPHTARSRPVQRNQCAVVWGGNRTAGRTAWFDAQGPSAHNGRSRWKITSQHNIAAPPHRHFSEQCVRPHQGVAERCFRVNISAQLAHEPEEI